jgi:hypothetical protein
MSQRVHPSTAVLLLLSLLSASATASAQEPAPPLAPSQTEAASAPAAPAPPPAPAPPSTEKLVVPTGTRLPLILRNGINTRTAKAGDSVYFETVYPIAVNNRMAIPMGSFVRGEILEAKRPGRVKGRGEFRIALEQMTFPNGYTIEFRAIPSSVDRNGQEGVDSEGRVKGPSSKGKDVVTVLVATAGGAYIGSLVGAVVNDAPGRGALIGGGAAGIGALIAVLATRGPEAELPRGTTMDVTFDRPLILDAAYLPTNAGSGVDPQSRVAAPVADTRRDAREAQKQRIQQSLLRSILFPRF